MLKKPKWVSHTIPSKFLSKIPHNKVEKILRIAYHYTECSRKEKIDECSRKEKIDEKIGVSASLRKRSPKVASTESIKFSFGGGWGRETFI